MLKSFGLSKDDHDLLLLFLSANRATNKNDLEGVRLAKLVKVATEDVTLTKQALFGKKIKLALREREREKLRFVGWLCKRH
jgi:hypothetical protein